MKIWTKVKKFQTQFFDTFHILVIQKLHHNSLSISLTN